MRKALAVMLLLVTLTGCGAVTEGFEQGLVDAELAEQAKQSEQAQVETGPHTERDERTPAPRSPQPIATETPAPDKKRIVAEQPEASQPDPPPPAPKPEPALAEPAPPQRDYDREAYLIKVGTDTELGPSLSRDERLELARAICADFDAGQDLMGVGIGIATVLADGTPDNRAYEQAGIWMGAAVAGLCPQHRERLGG